MAEHLSFHTEQAPDQPIDHVAALAKFGTEGFLPYQQESFIEYIETHDIKPGDFIEQMIDRSLLKKSHNAFVDTNTAKRILDAYLNIQPEVARGYVREKLNLECVNEADFLKNKAFLALARDYFFDVLVLGPGVDKDSRMENLKLAESDVLWQEFRQMLSMGGGSWLLQKHAHYIRQEAEGQLSDNKVQFFQVGPETVAPQQYGFDSEASFWLTVRHDQAHSEHGLYISRPDDFETITKLIASSGWQPKTFISQELYDAIQPYFHRAKRDDVLVHPRNPNQFLARDHLQLFEYRELNKPFFRDNITDLVGVDSITDLDLKTQFQLFHYVKNIDTAQAERLRDFAQQHQVLGLQTFLSLAHAGSDMGDAIIDFAQRHEPKEATEVFQAYQRIINRIEGIIVRAQALYGDQINQADIQRIERNLYFMAKDLLQDATKATDISQFLVDLQTVDEGLYEFTQLYARYRGDLESLGFGYHTYSAKEIADQKENMLQQFMRSRAGFSGTRALDQLRATFNTVTQPGSPEKFFTLESTASDSTAGFLSFHEPAPGVLWVRSLSFQAQAAHPMIALEFMQKFIDQHGGRNTLQAAVAVHNPIVRMYIKRFGFKIVDTIENYNDTGETYHLVKRDPQTLAADQPPATDFQTPTS